MSREVIFEAIRAANFQRSTAEPAPQLRGPSRAPQSHRAHCDAFIARLTACGVCVEELPSWDFIPAAVLRYLTAARLPLIIRHGGDPAIAALPWHQAPDLQRRSGAANKDDQAALSCALSGIAETGTLLLTSGADNPVTLAFLPELHIVLVDSAKIVETMEEALSSVGKAGGVPRLPRTVNMISGASRTGDIGGRLVMGAHGPRQLVVLMARGPNENGGAEGAAWLGHS